MRTIGILGGMSAASTQIYYARLCEKVRARLGGLHSPQLLIRSLDFAEVEALQQADEWAQAGRLLNRHAKALQRGGAELLLLATNTMHKVADEMMAGVDIPMLHIADATAAAVAAAGLSQPGLMATAFTMEQTFYTDRLRGAGLQPVIPGARDRAEIHRIIYDELCKEIVLDESLTAFESIARRLVASGADSLILGCTEVGLLLNDQNTPAPAFDTTDIHCQAAVRWALDES